MTNYTHFYTKCQNIFGNLSYFYILFQKVAIIIVLDFFHNLDKSQREEKKMKLCKIFFKA